MKQYPVKIILAWAEAAVGNEKIGLWLFENGYPELIAVMDFLWGSTKAGKWFLDNKMPHWRAFSEYVGDENPGARQWLVQHKFDMLVEVGDAVHEIEGAKELLLRENKKDLLLLANNLNKLLYNIEFDTNMVYRSPIS